MDIVIDGYHLNYREQIVLAAAAVTGLSFVTGMVGAWIGAWWGGRRAARRAVRDALRDGVAAPSVETEARLAQMSRSVDAMALEIERISEGQRFLVKVMSERESPRLPIGAPQPGAITPH